MSGRPFDRSVRDAQSFENLLVKVLFAIEERLHRAEEQAGFGALNDAVIVGAGDRHHLADTERSDHVGRGAAIFGRVIHCADGDDCALSGDEARHGSHGADGAGVRQRDAGALEIGDAQFAGAGARDEIVERSEVLGEGHLARVPDVGDEETAGAVLARDVDRDTEVDFLLDDAEQLARGVGCEGVIQRRIGLDGFHDGPSNEMRVGNLALVEQRAVVIDETPVLVDDLDRDDALRGGQRDGRAQGHVFGNAGSGAAQRHEFFGAG